MKEDVMVSNPILYQQEEMSDEKEIDDQESFEDSNVDYKDEDFNNRHRRDLDLP